MTHRIQQAVKIIVPVVVLVLFGWLFMRGTDWDNLFDVMMRVHKGWLLLACVPILASFVLRVLRWKYIVRSVKPVGFKKLFTATQIGFLINFTIGLRLGEFARALVLARNSSLSFAKCLALGSLDRVADLVGLIVVLLVSIYAADQISDVTIPAETFGTRNAIEIPTAYITQGARGFAVLLLGLIGVLVLLFVAREPMLKLTRAIWSPISTKMADWACHLFEQFSEGLHVFKSGKDMALSMGYSLLTWGCFLLSLQFFGYAFGIAMPWYTVFITQALLAVAVSIPATGGYIGVFHIPIVASLVMCVPDIDPDRAKALAIVAHAFNLFFICLLGVISLAMEGMSFVEVTKQGARAQDEAAETHPAAEGLRELDEETR